MIFIPPLQPGNLIAVVAPAGKVTPEEIMPGVDWLEKRGYQVWLGPNLFGRSFQFSGTDGERLSDLEQALGHGEARAIIFARGGYGTIRIASRADFTKFRENPRWLAGYSDITILHNICASMGIPSVHGAMLRNSIGTDGQPSGGFVRMIEMLEGKRNGYRVGYHALNRAGKTSAPIIGGNLSLLYSLLGTPFDIDTRGKILFIEEVGEYLYHTERMMISLRLAGKLSGLKGLVVGGFSEVKDNPEPFGMTVEEIITETVRDFDYPVCFGFPAGHGKVNLPLEFGTVMDLSVDSEGSCLHWPETLNEHTS
jgi:muramoyltetrapeptide carboxypeptidase